MMRLWFQLFEIIVQASGAMFYNEIIVIYASRNDVLFLIPVMQKCQLIEDLYC
jgi:hypothetical protein